VASNAIKPSFKYFIGSYPTPDHEDIAQATGNGDETVKARISSWPRVVAAGTGLGADYRKPDDIVVMGWRVPSSWSCPMGDRGLLCRRESPCADAGFRAAQYAARAPKRPPMIP
jgi:hypothetical protein